MKFTSCVLACCFMAACTFIAACSSAEPPKALVNSSSATVDCEFTFAEPGPCHYTEPGHKVNVRLETSPVADDELALNKLHVSHNGNTSILAISPDITLIEGDRGSISFTDINFDSIPDLAITTSFGVANLYLDYWVYHADKQQYVAVGNFPQFTLDKKTKTLTAEVKLNAANYAQKAWVWQGNKLVAVDK